MDEKIMIMLLWEEVPMRQFAVSKTKKLFKMTRCLFHILKKDARVRPQCVKWNVCINNSGIRYKEDCSRRDFFGNRSEN